jgi:four helix bundle protein
MQPYEPLDAWRAAHELAVAVHRATDRWPATERYGLTAQVRRAAFSVPLNIVEGRARFGPREFRRFLDIAWGSLAELEYSLRLAQDLGYLTPDAFKSLQVLRDKTAKPLFGLLRSVGRHS